jgi:hypothetical protein
MGLLSDVTRIFREHGLSVARAGVSTRNNKASNVFYVTDASGMVAVPRVLEAVRREIGQAVLRVSEIHLFPSPLASTEQARISKLFSLGSLFGSPSQVLYTLGLIRSYS